MKRKNPLVVGQIYHIFNRSIADYKIFKTDEDYSRMINTLRFYQILNPPTRFSLYLETPLVRKIGFQKSFESFNAEPKIVEIIAYCIMPTHPHLILKELIEGGISTFMRKVLNSYSSYFNVKHKRNGPLWENRFKNILVENDEQLLHLSRYLHLNPVTAFLVDNPNQWPYSSYSEYIGEHTNNRLTRLEGIIDIKPQAYRKFVADRADYQRELGKIKKLTLGY